MDSGHNQSDRGSNASHKNEDKKCLLGQNCLSLKKKKDKQFSKESRCLWVWVFFLKKMYFVHIGLKIGRGRDKGTLIASLFGVSKNTFPWESFKRYKMRQVSPFYSNYSFFYLQISQASFDFDSLSITFREVLVYSMGLF